VETAYLPYRRFPDLFSQVQNDKSLYVVLAENYQSVPTWADAEIEARSPTKEEATLLNIHARVPVLAAQRVTFTANYDIIETVHSVYRGDRFTFFTGRQFIG
jgi:GntR family transcriptional regulator